MTTRLLLCALLLWSVGATTIPSRPPAHGIRDTLTISQLQPANLRKDQCYVVTDAGGASDCATGAGTILNICCSDGLNYFAVGDGAGAGSYDLNFAGDSGTGIIVDAETFTLTGGNGIVTAAAVNDLNIVIDLNVSLDGVGLQSTFSGMEFTDSNRLALLQGCADGEVLAWNDIPATWDCGAVGGGGGHELLSITHSDTVPNAVTRGSIIIGDVVPAWRELDVGAANLVHLLNNTTDVFWGDSDSADFILEQTTVPGVNGGIIIDTNADNSNIVDAVLMFQSGATDYHIPSMRAFPVTQAEVLSIDTTANQFVYKVITGGTVQVQAGDASIDLSMRTASAGAIDSGTAPATLDGAIVIDTNGDGVNIAHDTLTFQSGGEDFVIPAPREYPTVDGQVLKFSDTNDDWEWATDVVLTQEEVEDFAGVMVERVTGTHTGISVTYQDATSDMDFIILLNTSADGVGSSSNLSGLEFTTSNGIALLQGCTDNQFLQWEDTGATWDCATPAGSVDSFAVWNGTTGTNPEADGPADTINLTEGLAIDIVGTAGTDTMNWAFDPTEILDTTWGDGIETTLAWTFNSSGGTDLEILFGQAIMQLDGTIQLLDGVGDSPNLNFVPATSGFWGLQVLEASGNFDFRASSASTEVLVIRNVGVGDVNVDIDGTLVLGTPASTNIAGAGAYVAASIDGDDINANIAGDGLILTPDAPDTLDIDLNATLDGAGLTSSLSGMEFTATAELALLQGCANNDVLQWVDAGATWDCAAAAGGGSMSSFDITDTDASPILTVNDTEQIQFIGGTAVTVVAAADGSNHDVTFSCDAATLTTTGCLEQATQAEADAGTAGNLAVIASVLEAWNGGSNVVTVGTITTGVWNGTALVDAFVSDVITVGATGTVVAGAYNAASIDGDDVNTNIAGDGLILTADAPDTLDIDLNATLDGVGATSNLSGMEFTATNELALLQGCADSDILTWEDTGGTWDCAAPGGGTTHDILSATHTDSLAATVSRGSIIVGNVTPAWSELVIGAAGTRLFSDGTDATWVDSDTAAFLLAGAVPATADGGIVIDTDGDATEVIDDVLTFQSGGIDYNIPSLRTYPTSNAHVIAVNRTTDQYVWKPLTSGNGISVAGGATNITINMVTEGVNAIHAATVPTTAENSLGIDTNGDSTNILHDTLSFRSGSENFFIPAAREYPTVDNSCLVLNATNDDWEWSSTSCTAGGGTMSSFDITDTDASPILTVNDAEQIQFIGGTALTVVAAADGSNHDVTFSCDASTATTTGCLEQATQAEADAGTAGNLAVIASVLEAWNGGSNIVTVGTITTGVWNGTALTDAFVSDTLTASLFVGSGSTTTAIDLATAEVAGILPDGNVADTLTIGASSTIAAGAYTAASIDGDDINSNIAGDGLILTAAAPDTLDIDLNATLDGVGSASNLSGMEFTATAELALLQGCTAGQVLKWEDTGATWDCAADDDSGGATAWDAIGDPAGNGDILFADTAQLMSWDTPATATARDAFTFRFTHDASTDATTQRGVVIKRLASAGTATLETLLQIKNEDTDGGVNTGIEILSDGAAIVTALDASDATIVTALAIGLNTITTGTPTTIAAAELDRLDGLAGIIVTDGTAVTDVEGAGLLISGAVLRVDSLQGNFLRVSTSSAVNDGALVIDSNGDGTNILNDVLVFQSGSEDFFVPAPREYPTVDGQVLKFNATNDDWEWGTDNDTQLTQEQVEDFAGALVANATGTHTGIAITYQDATADMDFIVDHDGGINFVADEHVAHTGVVITAGTGLTGGSNIAASFTIDAAGGDGIIANANDLAVDLNATLDGVGATSNLSGMEFTATAELALLQGCSAGQVLKWEDTGATWDCAADNDTGGSPALSDITDPVGDVSFTFDDGEEIDWVMTHSGPVGTDVFHIDFTQPDDADATDDIDVFMITMSLESGDAGDTIRAMKIVLNDGVANTILDAGWQIINDETTAGTIVDAIRVLSPGVDGGIIDAIDASAANIDNALNMGSNNIVTGSATISGGEMNILDGGILITELTTGTKANLESILSDVADLAEADGDIFTGVHDFGGATSLEIVNAAAPVVDTLGEIAVDTTDVPVTDGVAQLIYHDGGEVVMIPGVKHACFDIEELVAADDDFAIWSPPYAVTIRGGYCYCNGACTVAGTVHFEKNRAGTITQIGGASTTGDIACSNSSAATEALTDLTSGTLTLQSFDQLRFDTITGPTAVNSMNICWTYTADRQ